MGNMVNLKEYSDWKLLLENVYRVDDMLHASIDNGCKVAELEMIMGNDNVDICSYSENDNKEIIEVFFKVQANDI